MKRSKTKDESLVSSFAPTQTPNRLLNLGTPKNWPQIAGLLAVLGCAPHKASPEVNASPASRASASPLDAAAKTNAAPVPLRFERIASGPCGDVPRIEDAGASTLLISPHLVRFVTPGRPWRDARDAGAGLPASRGAGWVFSRTPLIVQLEREPRQDPPAVASESDFVRYRFSNDRWILQQESFGEIALALPVDSGTVVIAWLDGRAQHRGDLDDVPVGNMTQAWSITADGTVSALRNWPAVMTWQQQSTGHTLWATAARPGQNGQFLLRVPLLGQPRFYAIPGVSRCSGVDRLTGLATLSAVTDDTAQLDVYDGLDCVAKTAAGHYRFEHGRFTREGDPHFQDDEPRDHRFIATRDARFDLDGDESVTVTRHAGIEHDRLPSQDFPKRERSHQFRVTAGGAEVWLETRIQADRSQANTSDQCVIDRYLWPER